MKKVTLMIDLKNTDLKTIIRRKTHNVKLEDEFKYKDLPPDEVITVFTLHKEFYKLDKDEKIKLLKGLIDFSADEIGKIRYKI
jgi:hypothetical protein